MRNSTDIREDIAELTAMTFVIARKNENAADRMLIRFCSIRTNILSGLRDELRCAETAEREQLITLDEGFVRIKTPIHYGE